jgi:hypothetical protein
VTSETTTQAPEAGFERPAHRMKLLVHTGFANTDAHLFHHACAGARDALVAAGVLYPDLDVDLAVGGHAALARAVLKGDYEAVDRILGYLAVRGMAHGVHTVLLSTEEFTGLAEAQAQLEPFRKHVLNCFDELEFVAVSRALETLVYQQIRQAMMHFAFNPFAKDDHGQRMAEYVVGRQARLKDLLGDQLRIVAYEPLAAQPSFTNALLQACVPQVGTESLMIGPAPPTNPARIDGVAMFLPLLRAALASRHATNPYAPKVQAELQRIVPPAALQAFAAACEWQDIEDVLAEMVARQVERTVAALRDGRHGHLARGLAADQALAFAPPVQP